MANILVNIEKGIEVGAEDVLKWLTGAEKVLHAAPAVIAALATLGGSNGEATCGTCRRGRESAEHRTGHRDSEGSEGDMAGGEDFSGQPGSEVLTPVCELKE